METRAQNSKPAAPGKPFQKGQSGNPGGRKVIPPEIKEMARGASVRAIKRAVELIEHEDPNVALKAISTVLDRAYGKPAQAITGEGGEGPIQVAFNTVYERRGD